MRISAGIGLALLLAVAPAASAQNPVATVPLAVGEVLLELNSMGTATTRADSAEISIQISLQATDESDLRRRYDRTVARLRAAARDAGGEIEVNELLSYADMMTMNSADAITNAAIDPGMDLGSEHSGSSSAVIRLRDLGRIEALTRTLEGIEGIYSDTTYRASDDRAARRQARDNAIAAARAEADSYAASLGMRVGRIARVTERTQVDFFDMMLGGGEAMNAAMAQVAGAADGRDIRTASRVGVDFILVPR